MLRFGPDAESYSFPSHADQFVEAIAERTQHRVLVPLHAIGFVLSLRGERLSEPKPVSNGRHARTGSMVEAVHVADDREAGARLQREWQSLEQWVPLVVLESP